MHNVQNNLFRFYFLDFWRSRKSVRHWPLGLCPGSWSSATSGWSGAPSPTTSASTSWSVNHKQATYVFTIDRSVQRNCQECTDIYMGKSCKNHDFSNENNGMVRRNSVHLNGNEWPGLSVCRLVSRSTCLS